MSLRLGRTLRLGQFTAELVTEQSFAEALPRVERCAVAGADYLERAEGIHASGRWAADRISDALADDELRLFTLLSGVKRSPVGLLELQLDHPGPDEATVVLLLLDQALRGKGAGREIAERLFESLGDEGFTSVNLGVAWREKRAARFWSSVGMVEAGEARGVKLFERAL